MLIGGKKTPKPQKPVIQTILNNKWQHSKYAKANQVGMKYPNIKIPITPSFSAQDI